MKNNEIDKEVLNNMIQINSDRSLGYKRAIDELHSDDEDLKTVFAGMSRQSVNYKEALIQKLQEMEGDPKKEKTITGNISNSGIKTKAAFSDNDRQTVLNHCESREDSVKKAYKMALDTKGLSLTIKSILESQQTELIAAHNHIKVLRDSVAK